MATLNSIITDIRSEIGDISGNTFSTSELAILVNRGIDAVADVYPKEIVSVVGTVAANVYTYAVSDFSNIYRIDVHTSAGSYRAELPHAYEGRNSGWETHAGVLYIPPDWSLTAGDTLRAFGYGRYIQLSTGTSTTEMDTTAINAVRVFVASKAYNRLLMDRALFAQYQADPANSDVTAMALNQLAFSMKQEWAAERNRLRRIRKL
jgi:hypothetical protein